MFISFHMEVLLRSTPDEDCAGIMYSCRFSKFSVFIDLRIFVFSSSWTMDDLNGVSYRIGYVSSTVACAYD